jgi:signal transduction histidine kinase
VPRVYWPRGPYLRLRSHLILLVLSAVVPLVVFAFIIVRQDVNEQRALMERGMRDTVRALSLGIDGEVKTHVALLETLAAAVALDHGDLAAFHQVSERALRGRDGMYAILFDLDGKPLLNSSRPYGSVLPNPMTGAQAAGADPRYPETPLGGADPVKKVLASETPAVSDLFVSLVSRTPRISLDIPVIRNGRVRYVLELSVDAQQFTRLLAAQRPPGDSVIAIVDRNGVAVGRTLDPQTRVGRRLAPELARQIASADSGSGVGHTNEGLAVYHVFMRSPLTGWTTSLSVAQSVALAPLRRALAVLAAGAALAIVLALAAAVIVGWRITRPMSRLAHASDALARGEQPQLDVSAVREVDNLYQTLMKAGEAARDIAAERERRRLAEVRQAEADAASRAKDEFLAMLSHELRNPLAALTSAAHILRIADVASKPALEARRVIERQTKHMTRLIGDLLDVSRIAYGKLALERERFDLAEVIRRLFNVWQSSGRFERHRVSLEATSVWVDADRARIEQIAANLFDNAIKFTPAGKAVDIGVRAEGGAALLRVADQGVGVDAAAAERIFDLFVQMAPGSEGGLGIGLALVKRLTELHGGKVELETASPGGGTVFTVRLAVVAPAALDSAQPVASVASGCAVLVIDDNDDARDMLGALLRIDGHRVSIARDGRTGLALARETAPDIALIDIRLPDIDGYEIARRLRGVHNGKRITLVALSGLGRAEDEQRAVDAGFDAHLVKPVNVDRLKHLMAAAG